MGKDKYIQNPKTSAEYAHNREVANLKYKDVYLKSEAQKNDYKKAKNMLHNLIMDRHGNRPLPSVKERAWAEETVKIKKELDKQRKYWASQANKWKKLEEQATGKEEALKIGKGKSR